jgi:hypothetical protein
MRVARLGPGLSSLTRRAAVGVVSLSLRSPAMTSSSSRSSQSISCASSVVCLSIRTAPGCGTLLACRSRVRSTNTGAGRSSSTRGGGDTMRLSRRGSTWSACRVITLMGCRWRSFGARVARCRCCRRIVSGRLACSLSSWSGWRAGVTSGQAERLRPSIADGYLRRRGAVTSTRWRLIRPPARRCYARPRRVVTRSRRRLLLLGRRRDRGGWGATPVQARPVERQGGGKSGDSGSLAAWVVLAGLQRSLRALLARSGPAVWPAAQRGREPASAAVRRRPRAARPRFIPRTEQNQEGRQ